MKLPDTIPVQFGITLAPSDWGNKATIFIYPIVLLVVPVFTSKKIISLHEQSFASQISAEIITLIVLIAILLMMIGAYYCYFKMI